MGCAFSQACKSAQHLHKGNRELITSKYPLFFFPSLQGSVPQVLGGEDSAGMGLNTGVLEGFPSSPSAC